MKVISLLEYKEQKEKEINLRKRKQECYDEVINFCKREPLHSTIPNSKIIIEKERKINPTFLNLLEKYSRIRGMEEELLNVSSKIKRREEFDYAFLKLLDLFLEEEYPDAFWRFNVWLDKIEKGE